MPAGTTLQDHRVWTVQPTATGGASRLPPSYYMPQANHQSAPVYPPSIPSYGPGPDITGAGGAIGPGGAAQPPPGWMAATTTSELPDLPPPAYSEIFPDHTSVPPKPSDGT